MNKNKTESVIIIDKNQFQKLYSELATNIIEIGETIDHDLQTRKMLDDTNKSANKLYEYVMLQKSLLITYEK